LGPTWLSLRFASTHRAAEKGVFSESGLPEMPILGN
jgi:hypothetical protein